MCLGGLGLNRLDRASSSIITFEWIYDFDTLIICTSTELLPLPITITIIAYTEQHKINTLMPKTSSVSSINIYLSLLRPREHKPINSNH